MKFSSNFLMLILIATSSMFLYSCSHSSCPAYTYQKDKVIKKEVDYEDENIVINRGV